MSDQGRPKSSWQSWVRSTEARRSTDAPVADADLDVAPQVEDALDDEALDEEVEELGIDEAGADAEPASSWTSWPEADDGDGDAEAEADEIVVDATVVHDDDDDDDDDGDEDDAADDDDGDDGEFGELLPAVPLLPSIAGRVEALSGVLRSITHRVDGLSAATDVYRATVVDRIDQFTETVLEQGRRSDQSLDEYRRSTERTIGELRRGLGEQSDGSKRLLARVEEIATDVASLLHAEPAVRHEEPPPAADPAPAVDPAWVEHIDASLDEVARAQQATAQALADVQQLVAAIVDTMPASAEGSAADVAGALAGVEATLEALVESVAAAPAGAPPPAPAPAPPPPAPIIDDATVATIADAIVDRLDLDALAMLVAEHLSATFEVVDESAAEPASEAPEPPAAPTGGRRKKS